MYKPEVQASVFSISFTRLRWVLVFFVAFFGLITAMTSAVLGQDNWPEHRGPQRNYHLTSKTEYPNKWSVGKYHFFMGGGPGILGRIDLETDEVSCLQVPVQVVVENGTTKFSWSEFESGDKTGSGFVVEGDKRRLSHGFGHISAATPIVVNNHIYFSTVLGTVYVVDATTERFDEDSLVAVNDLGLPGKTWTLAPFTAANGHLYQRTSREIICIGD